MKALCLKLFWFINVLVLSTNFTVAQFGWTKYSGNPLNIHGSSGSWDENVLVPYVIFNADLNRYEMWYTAFNGTYPNGGIGFAISTDGITWNKQPNPVLTSSTTGWDSLFVGAPCILKESGLYKMWYTGWRSATRVSASIGYATSPDGINWTKHSNPVLGPGTQGWETDAVSYCDVLPVAGGYWMFYSGSASGVALVGRAFSTDGISWQRDLANNPVLLPGNIGAWDQNSYLPRLLELNNTLYLWYTAETNPGVGGTAIGFATSIDTGKTWTKYSGNPVLTRGTTGSWDNVWIETGSVLFTQNEAKLYYDGGGSATGNKGRVGLATSLIVPVELTLFTAESGNQKVVLRWITSTELNNHGFEIQRKVAESEFATIGFVRGEGTTANHKEYSFVDKDLVDGKYFYRLKQVDYNGTCEYSDLIEVDVRSLNEYVLEQNFPNPFNPITTIGYVLKEKATTKLILLNAIGEEMAVLVNEEQDKGFHKVGFNAVNLPSGVYFYQLRAGDYNSLKKMILLK